MTEIPPDLLIAPEDIVDSALADMIDAAVSMALSVIEAGTDKTDLQVPVAGLRKAADQIAAEIIVKLTRAITSFSSIEQAKS